MSEDPLYREIILEHWQNPQNYGTIASPDIDISGHNPICGDQIRITAKIRNGTITEIGFTSEGCAISKASASIFTEDLRGKNIAKVKSMTHEKVLENLGIELSPARLKCALLPYSTFQRGL